MNCNYSWNATAWAILVREGMAMMGHQWRSEYDRTAVVVLQCGDEPRYSTGASSLT